MKSFFLLTAAGLTLSACAGGYADEALDPAERLSGGLCDAKPVQKYLGEFLTDALAETIREESGATILRTGGPSDIWTMDYREERVSIGYGNGRIIERIACG